MGESTKLYDVLIVGGGPAGATAALYTSRSLLKTLIVEKGTMGGNIVNTEKIENYPGFTGGIEAFELAMRFRDHSVEFGAEITNAEVKGIKIEGGLKILETDQGELRGKALIIATGLVPVKLNVPGEKEYWGRGVSACATCDGPFFKDQVVAAVGGGNSAVEEALYLTRFAKEVHLIHRRDQLRAVKVIQERALSEPKMKFHWNCIVKEIKGTEGVGSLVLENVMTHERKDLPVDGVFVYIGFKPMTEWVGEALDKDKQGYLKVDRDMKTNVPGIFAAGDVANPVYRQVIIAAGEGARAAISAEKYIVEHW